MFFMLIPTIKYYCTNDNVAYYIMSHVHKQLFLRLIMS